LARVKTARTTPTLVALRAHGSFRGCELNCETDAEEGHVVLRPSTPSTSPTTTLTAFAALRS